MAAGAGLRYKSGNSRTVIAIMQRTQLVRRTALAILLLAGAVAAPSGAQEADEQIRARVEELASTGVLEAAGVPIAARNLIPRIYEARKFEPTWRSAEQIDGLLEVIGDSYLEGLDPQDYHLDAVRSAREAFANLAALSPGDRASYDIMLTDSVIRLGYHLRFGKVDPVALDSHWNGVRDLGDEDPAKTIQSAIDSSSLRKFAAEVIPRPFLYDRFKAALAQYRALAAAGGWPTVPTGPTLKAGMTDARVPVLAQRLAVTGDLALIAAGAATTLYDGDVVAAVERFQQRHGLTADGAVGPATLAEMNVTVEQRIEQIRANLERARWVTYDPASEFIAVNIAGFQAYLLRRGEIVWRSRVQVGRPFTQTPVFAAKMTYLVFNPTWTVPPGILRNETLPAIRRDPGYLAARDMDMFDSSGNIVDPASVDWSKTRGTGFRVVQRPGPNNALGRVKFMFPNEHSVYLHDTPSRNLFERDSRAFSHGCIRVDDVYGLALRLLGSRWDRERIDALIAKGKTETVVLDKPMPVMLLYWTTEPDATGRISFFPDVYSRDAPVIAALAQPFRPSERM
jgi:L,D-transpeptidase YcbB